MVKELSVRSEISIGKEACIKKMLTRNVIYTPSVNGKTKNT